MKYIVDIKGEIEGDYEIIGKYEERLPEAFASAQPEIIRCKDCKKAPICYGDVIMQSKGGGYIYCPVDYCSEAERRIDE